jgi:hypothetical protein
MGTTHESTGEHGGPEYYEIRIRGHLEKRWAEWFDGLRMTLDANGETVLTGTVVDQAALYGLLRKVRDLGLPLVSVRQVSSKPANTPDDDEDTDHNSSNMETNP